MKRFVSIAAAVAAALAVTVGASAQFADTTTNQADAESFVALARRALTTCGPAGSPDATTAAQAYATSVTDLHAGRYDPAKVVARVAIDRCAAAQLATVQAAPNAGATLAPAAMASYMPLPVATLIPDPALQQHH